MVVDLNKRLRRQAGVISRAQALDAGLSDSAIRRRLGDARWRQLHPRVYLAADRPYTDEVRLRAAVLWAGPGAVAHGVSAAWWYELWHGLPRPVDVTVPRGRRPRRRPGIRVRQRDVDELDLTEHEFLPVTGAPLAAIEAAVALGPRGAVLLDRALQTQVDFGWVWRAHCRNFGRRGSTAASSLLIAAADRAASQAERLLVKLLREAGITGWKLGYPFHGFLLDLAFPQRRIAIEVDGWAWHTDPERFVRDRQRQNALVNGRWTILRFSWHDLTARPGEVLAEIRVHLP